jgi:hypothetical protein
MSTEFNWTGYGRAGKHTPVPGEALLTYECLACEAILTPESDPEADCPGRKARPAKGPRGAEERGDG